MFLCRMWWVSFRALFVVINEWVILEKSSNKKNSNWAPRTWMQPGDLGLVRFIKYRYEKMKLFFFIFVYACGDSYTVNFRHPGSFLWNMCGRRWSQKWTWVILIYGAAWWNLFSVVANSDAVCTGMLPETVWWVTASYMSGAILRWHACHLYDVCVTYIYY